MQEENEEDGDEEDEREYDPSSGEWGLNLDGMVSDERGNGYDENGNWEDEWREQLNAVEIEDRVEQSPIVMENSDPHQLPVTEVCDDCHSLDHGDVVSREYTNSVEYQDVSSMSDQRYSFISCQNHLQNTEMDQVNEEVDVPFRLYRSQRRSRPTNTSKDPPYYP